MSASGRIYERLAARYGQQHVFKDVDSLEGGDDFAKTIRETIPRSAAVLVVIGRTWLEARDDAGRRRLDDPEDFVRREVEAALDDGVAVVPVLVEGARMPELGQLPASLGRLPALNAVVVNNDPDFDTGVRRLMRAVDPLLPPGMRPQVRRRRQAFSALGALCLVALLAFLVRPLIFPMPSQQSNAYGGPSTYGDTIEHVVTLSNGQAWATGFRKHVATTRGTPDPCELTSDGFILRHDPDQAGWSRAYTQPCTALLAIGVSASGDTGWAVGKDLYSRSPKNTTTLLHLTNGVWSNTASSPTDAVLQDMALSASGDTGWAVGNTGTLLQLSNGVWSLGNSPTTDTLHGVALSPSGNEGWSVGENGTILQLRAGVWSLVSSPTKVTLWSVALSASGSDGWAVGDNGTILRLVGPHWDKIYGPPGV
jgi:hypothetical protein